MLAARINDAREQYRSLGEELSSSNTIPACLSALSPEFDGLIYSYTGDKTKTFLKSSDPKLKMITIDDVVLAAEDFEMLAVPQQQTIMNQSPTQQKKDGKRGNKRQRSDSNASSTVFAGMAQH